MAKLNPKDPQFGIPIASRIHKDRALRLNAEAEKKGKSLSRYIAECLEKAEADEKKVKELIAIMNKEKEAVGLREGRIKELEAQLIQEKEKVKAKASELAKLEAWLFREKEIMKTTASRFIIEISKGNNKQAKQLIQTYNTILKDEKSK